MTTGQLKFWSSVL